ncbi:MAG: IS4/IS5 family transposase, partial [Planctomycetes bacterium]|nr:IS4/IS5 family transposase [Planctomycetota bacterium]
VFFDDHDWKALTCFSTKTSTPPDLPPSLSEATRLVARLGGFIDRKCDGLPGNEVIWRGLERLHDISTSWLLFSPHAKDKN